MSIVKQFLDKVIDTFVGVQHQVTVVEKVQKIAEVHHMK